jgi:S1-C subfamily serine protease
MKRAIAGLLVFSAWMVILQPAARAAAAADWATVADKLAKSIVYIETKAGSCTGFVVNADATNKDKERVSWILSAAHCDGEEVYADQTSAHVLFKDTKRDLLVLETADLNRPALAIATDNPKLGEEIASYGYGWSLERPMFRVAHVSDDRTYIAEDGIGGPLIVIDAQYVPGQSGGPVVNAAGQVVSIVQRGGQGVGIGIGAETIRGKVGRYLQKAKAP